MNHRIVLSRALLLSLALLISRADPARGAPPAPAQPISLPYALRDASGASLMVNVDGSLTDGQGEFLNAGGQLYVGNDFEYAPEQPQAGFDAGRNEVVFPPVPGRGQAQGLTISRRVSLDPKGGWWRFVEQFDNSGGAPVRAAVRVHFELGNGVQSVEQVPGEGRAGAPVGAAVGDGNRFLALLGGSRRSGARVRPQVSAQAGGEGVDVRYDVEVLPRKTLTIVHFLSLRPGLNEALDFVRSSKDADLLKGLPPEVLKGLANFPTGQHMVGGLDVLRGEMFDVVELRGGDVYKGTLADKSYALQTPYGLLELPAERVVAMVTLGQFRPTQLLVTADGEVFGGTHKADALRLELSSGQVTAVPLAGVRRFGYRKRPGEGEDAAPQVPKGKAIVVLRAGDRVAVEPPASPITVASCYGVLRLDPRTVASVALQCDEHGVHAIRLIDGSRFAGVVLQDRFELKPAGAAATGASGPLGFAAASVARLQLAPEPEEPGDGAAQLALSNGDVLACGLTGRLVLETGFDAIEVEAAQLQALRRGGAGDGDDEGAAAPAAGEVQLTLWDGTTLSGRVRGDTLDCTLQCGAAVKVPVAMVRKYTQPTPRPSPQVVERIKAVVAELNADDWKLRDRAAAQLVSIGPSAAAVLRELKDGQPPEVRQRIDQILSGFEQERGGTKAGSAHGNDE